MAVPTEVPREALVDVTGVAHGGYGVCRIEGQVCFVADALPGDRARVRIVRETKGVLWGEIIEVASPSPHRTPADCPCYAECGGCAWMHFAYPAQADWKQRIVADSLQRIAKLDTPVYWLDDAGLRLGYRTRAEFHGDGVNWGFYARRSHEIVDIDHCMLCHLKLNEAFQRLRATDCRGSVTLTVNPDGDEVLVWTSEAVPALVAAFEHTNWPRDGKPRATFEFDGVPIVNGAFTQSSLLLNRLLVGKVHDAVGDAARVLDLYCGNGNLTLTLPASSEKLVGIDGNAEAVAAAHAVGRGDYRHGSEDRFKPLLREPWDVVVLDPPRVGAKAIAADLARVDARRIVYVSCDPATLARDLKTLTSAGWTLAETTAIDLFPHTPHIETVAVLDRA